MTPYYLFRAGFRPDKEGKGGLQTLAVIVTQGKTSLTPHLTSPKR